MKGKKKWSLALLCSLCSLLLSGLFLTEKTSAISVNQTYHNYLWNTDTTGSQAYSLYEPGTRNVGTTLYTGAFKIGRVQFSFPVNMHDLASATTLNLSFRIEGTDGGYNGKNEIRLNSTGQYSIQSGACTASAPQYSPDLRNIYFDYNCNYNLKSQSSIGELWFDIGNFGIENGTSGRTEGLFNSASSSGSLKFVYIEYNYQTNPSYEEQQNQTIINQNQEQLQIQQQQQQQDQQDRNQIESTSEDAEQQGEAAGAAANATGQTLMQAFTSLVTALTGIHETNCNLPNFSLYGLNFKNMNMCMFDVPNGLMSLASIGMVFIIVPLGINLVKRMIALYNEIVGGGK